MRKSALGPLVLLLVGGLLGFQARPTPAILEAQQFRLVDASGRSRGGLTVPPDGSAGLALLDESGHTRAILDSDGLTFLDGAGKVRVSIASTPNGIGLILSDERGNSRFVLTYQDGAEAIATALDASGRVVGTWPR